MTPSFALSGWAAWAPGLSDEESWRDWLQRPYPLPTDEAPPLPQMPAALRRRVERLGRVALQATYSCRDGRACPVVFASRYGDSVRTDSLLRQLAESALVSPTSFALSVHNAVGALYSIATRDTSAYTALAAGPETVEAAFTEACGVLDDGADSVLVVVYDEPLPAPWDRFEEGPSFPRAFACRIVPVDRGSTFSLRCGAGPGLADGAQPSLVPPDLAVLRFLISGEECLDRDVGGRRWHWRRHG